MIMRAALLTSVAPCAFANEPPPGSPGTLDANGNYVPTADDIQKAREYHASQGGNGVSDDPIIKRSAGSAAMLEYWDLSDAIVDGVNAVRLAGNRYMPKFVDEDTDVYNYRLRCTKMTNVYRDSLEVLASKPFEQEVSLVVDEGNAIPEQLLKFVEDVDGSGSNLTQYASATFFNGINSVLDWIFIDYPPPNPNIRTIADQKKAALRPYWSRVLARNVLEARSKVIGGDEVLTYIRIFEPGAPDHVRVFERMDNGVIAWRLYVKNTNDGKYSIETEGVLTIDVIPLVPFTTGRRDGRTWRFFPVMRDAADLQIELYQQESGLKFAKILTAYPMLAGNGVKPQMMPDGKTIAKIAVGPNRVLYAPPDGSGKAGSWAYVEPSAASLKFLAEDIKETIQQLREISRQPLTAQSGNLTVITAATAAGKAKSAVGAWAFLLKNALENAFVITCKWFGIAPETYDPVVFVYTDFDEFTEGKDLEDLNSMRAGGDLSQATYWHEKKRRGVLSPEFDPEEEIKRLLKEVPKDNGGDDIDDPPPT